MRCQVIASMHETFYFRRPVAVTERADTNLAPVVCKGGDQAAEPSLGSPVDCSTTVPSTTSVTNVCRGGDRAEEPSPGGAPFRHSTTAPSTSAGASPFRVGNGPVSNSLGDSQLGCLGATSSTTGPGVEAMCSGGSPFGISATASSASIGVLGRDSGSVSSTNIVRLVNSIARQPIRRGVGQPHVQFLYVHATLPLDSKS